MPNTEDTAKAIASALFRLLADAEWPGIRIPGIYSIDRSIYDNSFKVIVSNRTYWVEVKSE